LKRSGYLITLLISQTRLISSGPETFPARHLLARRGLTVFPIVYSPNEEFLTTPGWKEPIPGVLCFLFRLFSSNEFKIPDGRRGKEIPRLAVDFFFKVTGSMFYLLAKKKPLSLSLSLCLSYKAKCPTIQFYCTNLFKRLVCLFKNKEIQKKIWLSPQ
jgi:hypothetical protein